MRGVSHCPANNPGGESAVRATYRGLALGEFLAWLRLNRGPYGWPASEYAAEVDRLTVEYLRGVGWVPGLPLTANWRDLVDAVSEAADVAWRGCTGNEPGRTGRHAAG